MTRSADIAALLTQAVRLHQAGQFNEAEALYKRVLQAAPTNADALNLSGLISEARGDWHGALACFEKACAKAPRMASAFYNKARALDQLQDAVQAASAYSQATALNPQYADAYLNLGALHYKGGAIEKALATFAEMVRQCPGDARGHYNLGRCLVDIKAYERAELALDTALKLAPGYVDALMTLAKLCADTHRLERAATLAKEAAALAPSNVVAQTNYGSYLSRLDRHDQALAVLDHAVQLDATYADARVNRGLTRLTLGQLAGGWDDYSVRKAAQGQPNFRKLNVACPEWQGEALAGKRIFVWGEQGLGDEILYSSILPEIAREAAYCAFGCAPRLVSLFKRSFPYLIVDDLRAILKSIDQHRFDFHISALDLGRWRRRSFAAFPNRAHYLQAAPDAAKKLRQRYQQVSQGKRLIGFSWRSYAPHVGDGKTPPLNVWQNLLRNPAIQLVALQYGEKVSVEGDLAAFEAAYGARPFYDAELDLNADLDSAAAQIQAMDGIVTVSNTAAHVAGALGVPGVVVVPHRTARLWYWFAAGGHSPWYRTLRVCRWDEGHPEHIIKCCQAFVAH